MLNSFRSIIANLIDPTRATTRAETLRLSSAETEDTITTGIRSGYNLRDNVKRATILQEAYIAWQTNPIAKAICELQTEFVVGDGFGFSSNNKKIQDFIKEFWEHPLNDIETQTSELAGEAWRTGDIFVIGSVDKTTAMTYYRGLPSDAVQEIETTENDYRQELAYKSGTHEQKSWRTYDSNKNYITDNQEFILHFPLNRAVGSTFGESDFATILYWLKLYRQFIEDRARLNFFRQLFTFIVSKAFGSQMEKDQYVKDFQARMPKKSGGVLAVDQDEVIATINPNLGSFEAGEDGMLIVRMIAVAVRFPLHWLGFAESNTRTTAEAAGTPAFRRLKARQKYMAQAIHRMTAVALEIKRKADNDLPADLEFTINAPDLTERDNKDLALSVLRMTQALSPLYNAKKISAKELLRLVYRFLAETPPAEEPDGTTPIATGGGGGQGSPEPEPTEPTDAE